MLGIMLGIMLPSLISVAQAGAGEHRVWIKTSVNEGRFVAVPQVTAAHEALLDYELISTKVGKAGRASSSQAGSVRLEEGETRALTRLGLGVAAEDQYILSLRVYENGDLVAEDSVSYP